MVSFGLIAAIGFFLLSRAVRKAFRPSVMASIIFMQPVTTIIMILGIRVCWPLSRAPCRVLAQSWLCYLRSLTAWLVLGLS